MSKPYGVRIGRCNLAVKLRQVDSGEVVRFKKALSNRPYALLNCQSLPKRKSKRKPRLSMSFSSIGFSRIEIRDLVSLPLVGQAVGKDAEVASVAGRAVGVAGEAVLEPAVNAPRSVLDAEHPFEKIGFRRRSRGRFLFLDHRGRGLG